MSLIYHFSQFSDKKIDADAIYVINTLLKGGFDAYLVGGCVRDLLFGLVPKDFDVVTDARPEQIKSLFKRARIIGRRFRLVHIIFARRKFLEVSTFRSKNVHIPEKHIKNPEQLYGSIAEDAKRRDFTMNALYYDIHSKKILDFTNGISDIKKKYLSLIGDLDVRYQEDPVRLLRAVRFQVRFGLKLSKEHEQSFIKYGPLLAKIPAARRYDESLKLFHNCNARKIFHHLKKYQLLQYLFAHTEQDALVDIYLKNTEERMQENKSITSAFLIAIFLWEIFQKTYKKRTKDHQKNPELFLKTADDVIKTQIEQTAFPKYITRYVKDIWFLQLGFKQKHEKKISKLLAHSHFRAAYDFLFCLAHSLNPELKPILDFWTNKEQAYLKKVKMKKVKI